MCIIPANQPLKSLIQFIPFSIQNVRTHICKMLLSHCVCLCVPWTQFNLSWVYLSVSVVRSLSLSLSGSRFRRVCSEMWSRFHINILVFYYCCTVALRLCVFRFSYGFLLLLLLQSAPYVILHKKKHFFLLSSFDVISRLMHFRSVVAHIWCKSNVQFVVGGCGRAATAAAAHDDRIKKRNDLILICLIDQPNGEHMFN